MWLFALVPSFIWKYVGLGAAALALYGYADIKATHREHVKCEAAAKAAQNAADEQDLKAEREGRAQDLEVTNNLVNQKKVDDEAIEKLKKEIASNPLYATCSYPVTAPAARSLRKSRGTQSGAGYAKPSRPAELPAPNNGASGETRR